MKNLNLALLFASFLVLNFGTAQADGVIKEFPAGGAKAILEETESHGNGAIKIKKDCTTSEGKKTFEGDKAYQACLKERLEKPKK